MEETLFIQKIKTALSHRSGTEKGGTPAPEIRPQPGPSAGLEERIQRFISETSELYKVGVFRVQDWREAREKISQMLAERGVKTIALAGKDLEPEDPFWKKWGPAADFSSIEKAEVGVVEADYGLAETGSVALAASPEKPRIASLLPAACFFVLPVSRLLQSVAHLMEELDAHNKKGGLPATVNVVTGPSRTADIELSLTVGVHGPGEVQVILVG